MIIPKEVLGTKRVTILFKKFVEILRRGANCGRVVAPVIYGYRWKRGSISLAITADLIMELNRDEPYFHLDRRLEGVADDFQLLPKHEESAFESETLS